MLLHSFDFFQVVDAFIYFTGIGSKGSCALEVTAVALACLEVDRATYTHALGIRSLSLESPLIFTTQLSSFHIKFTLVVYGMRVEARLLVGKDKFVGSMNGVLEFRFLQ